MYNSLRVTCKPETCSSSSYAKQIVQYAVPWLYPEKSQLETLWETLCPKPFACCYKSQFKCFSLKRANVLFTLSESLSQVSIPSPSGSKARLLLHVITV